MKKIFATIFAIIAVAMISTSCGKNESANAWKQADFPADEFAHVAAHTLSVYCVESVGTVMMKKDNNGYHFYIYNSECPFHYHSNTYFKWTDMRIGLFNENGELIKEYKSEKNFVSGYYSDYVMVNLDSGTNENTNSNFVGNFIMSEKGSVRFIGGGIDITVPCVKSSKLIMEKA